MTFQQKELRISVVPLYGVCLIRESFSENIMFFQDHLQGQKVNFKIKMRKCDFQLTELETRLRHFFTLI